MKTTAILLVLIISFSLTAQDFKVNYLGERDIKTYFNRPIGVDDEGYVYNYDQVVPIGTREEHYLTVLDSNSGKIIKNTLIRSLPFFKELNLSFIDESAAQEEVCVFHNGQLYLFAEGKSKGKEGVFILQVDHNLELEKDPFFIPTSASNCVEKCKHLVFNNRFNSDPSVNSFVSKVFSGKAKKEISEFKLLEFDHAQKVLKDKTIRFDDRKVSEIDFVSVGSNDYMLVETFTVGPQKGNLLGFIFKEKIYRDYVYVAGKDGKASQISIDVFDNENQLEQINIKKIGSNILISGLLKKDEKFIGIGTIVVDGNTSKTVSKQVHKFDPTIADGYEEVRFYEKRHLNQDEDKIENGEFSDTYELVESFLNNNNEVVNIYQNKYGFWATDRVIHRYTNMLVVNIKEDGMIKNITYLPTRQTDGTYDSRSGMKAFMSKNKLYIGHVSEPKITKVINEVNGNSDFKNIPEAKYLFGITSIDSDGNVKSHGVINKREKNIFGGPRELISDEKNMLFHIVSTRQYATGSRTFRWAIVEIEE